MKHYITQLKDDANASTEHPNIEWIDSSYHNDACGSIMAEFDDMAENYVQLFAFENMTEAKAEGFDEIYAITTCRNGSHDYAGFMTNDRGEAINKAIELAIEMQADILRCGGFEFDGVWITDRTKSPCGRFDLTEAESKALYG